MGVNVKMSNGKFRVQSTYGSSLFEGQCHLGVKVI